MFVVTQVIVPVAEKSSVKDGASGLIIPLLVDQTSTPYQPCVEDITDGAKEKDEKEDPWELPALQDNSPSWRG
jgi:hypothetical protein